MHKAWYGLYVNIGRTVFERMDHMVAKIMENYIIGIK